MNGEIVNTYDQLVAVGGGIAICKRWGGIRDRHIAGWVILRVNAKGLQIVTDPEAAWYDNNYKVFANSLHKGTFFQKQSLAFDEAAKWVAEKYGEVGPWKRNRMGDFVSERINKQFPLRKSI